ncbi:hypothetical protein CASFOL_038274 [Castilleja foliolosa]|uniref:Uncharacterized protein n=1 Tax=Castilleja foliolosa TaxID=1961234 RepID=A0ABD3BKI8_9LAMI
MATTTAKILRKSIFSVLQNYQYYTLTPTLVAFSYAVSYLLIQSLLPSSDIFLLPRLRSIFLSAGYSHSPNDIFALLNLKLSQTILTFLFVPHTFSSLLLARASIIINHRNPTSSFRAPLFVFPLLITQLCSTLVMLAANATYFVFFALCINFLDVLGLSSSRGYILFFSLVVIYSVVVANIYVICNLASVMSALENRGGFVLILKACVMIKGRITTALSLAVIMNTGLAAVEILFQYRVVRAYNRRDLVTKSGLLVIMEGGFIALLYAVFLVLDTVVGCTFWESCNKDENQIEIQDRDIKCFAQTHKALDVI